MARLTKAEREAMEAAVVAEEWEKFREEYPARFARVLYEFAKLQATGVRLGDERYSVEWLDAETYHFIHGWTDCELKVTAPVNRSTNVESNLVLLEREVREYWDEQAEEQRKANVRKAALWKLTDEERELLGL